MHRRTLLKVFLAAIATVTGARAQKPSSQEELDRRVAELRAKAIAAFPFEHVEVRGEDALATWTKLKAEDRGSPVVLGGDEDFDRVLMPFDPSNPFPMKSIEEILAAAARLRIPDDLFARRAQQDAGGEKAMKEILDKPDDQIPTVIERKDGSIVISFSSKDTPVPVPGFEDGRVMSPTEARAYLSKQSPGPDLGKWPDMPDTAPGLSVAMDLLKNMPLPSVHITLIPTQDWTEIPAYLRWGGWNDCPDPEYHVAALRSWRDRYSVELVGLSGDTMNLRGARPPLMRDEAIALAREQYAYCTDLVYQGTQTISNLAAALMANDWWFFWWD